MTRARPPLTGQPGTVLTATAPDLFAPRPNGDSDSAFVRGLYHTILGRDAEASGVSFWAGNLKSGSSRTKVTQDIWNSLEHRVQEVDAFYLTYLRRAPEAGGLKHWVGAL